MPKSSRLPACHSGIRYTNQREESYPSDQFPDLTEAQIQFIDAFEGYEVEDSSKYVPGLDSETVREWVRESPNFGAAYILRAAQNIAKANQGKAPLEVSRESAHLLRFVKMDLDVHQAHIGILIRRLWALPLEGLSWFGRPKSHNRKANRKAVQ